MFNIHVDYAYASYLCIFGIVAHLVADWLFQNHWMARYKVIGLQHPAAWVHAGIHLFFLLFVFPVYVSIIIATLHFIIDTRKPLQLWSRIIQTTNAGDITLHIDIWRDQVLHIAIIALFAFLLGGGILH